MNAYQILEALSNGQFVSFAIQKNSYIAARLDGEHFTVCKSTNPEGPWTKINIFKAISVISIFISADSTVLHRALNIRLRNITDVRILTQWPQEIIQGQTNNLDDPIYQQYSNAFLIKNLMAGEHLPLKIDRHSFTVGLHENDLFVMSDEETIIRHWSLLKYIKPDATPLSFRRDFIRHIASDAKGSLVYEDEKGDLYAYSRLDHNNQIVHLWYDAKTKKWRYDPTKDVLDFLTTQTTRQAITTKNIAFYHEQINYQDKVLPNGTKVDDCYIVNLQYKDYVIIQDKERMKTVRGDSIFSFPNNKPYTQEAQTVITWQQFTRSKSPDKLRAELLVRGYKNAFNISDQKLYELVDYVCASRLSDRALTVVTHAYGLAGQPAMKPKDIGLLLGISDARVGQIIEKFIRCLYRLPQDAHERFNAKQTRFAGAADVGILWLYTGAIAGKL